MTQENSSRVAFEADFRAKINHESTADWLLRTKESGGYISAATRTRYEGWQACEKRMQEEMEFLSDAALQVLDDMNCVADYDSVTDEPIWETDQTKRGVTCCQFARDQLQEALTRIGKGEGR